MVQSLAGHHRMVVGYNSDTTAAATFAGETRSLARDIGLEPKTAPIESPQSDGMAEAFIRTKKRDYLHVSPAAQC